MQKEHWEAIIDQILQNSNSFDKSKKKIPSPKNPNQKIGFALALTEYTVNNQTQYRRFCRLINHYKIDELLAKRYRRNPLPFFKIFYLSTLADLPCSKENSLFLDIIHRKNINDQIYIMALYGLSKTIRTVREAIYFFQLLNQGKELYLSLKYCELLAYIILRHLSLDEIELLIETLPKERLDNARCIAESLGRFRSQEMESALRKLYKHFRHNPEIIAAVIRSLYLSKISACDIVQELLDKTELPIRVNLAKFGLDLCPNSKQNRIAMMRFFFDKNYYVRQNIFQSFLRHNISKEEIKEIVQKFYPQKINDRFFADMLRLYDLERIKVV